MLVSRSFGSIFALAVGASGALAACGDDGNKPTDARVDGPPADANCTNYTGEIIDWNSNAGAGFCGVFHSTETVRGQALTTTTMGPNGRFTLCLAPSQSAITIDVTPPTADSECSSAPGKYTTPGALTLQPSLISSAQIASVRLPSDSELMAEFTAIGQTYMPSEGQLVVHTIGTPSKVTIVGGSIQSNCGGHRQFDGTRWNTATDASAPTNDIFFADCGLTNSAASPVTIKLENPAAASVDVTIEPGKFTYVTMVSP